MSNPNQNQQQQKQPEPWKPDRGTYFLIQSFDADFERRARAAIQRRWPQAQGVAKVVSEIQRYRLTEASTIIGVYYDPDADIIENGEPRARKREVRVGGKVTEKAEPPEVKFTPPILCEQFVTDVGEGDTAISLGPIQGEDGTRPKSGLLGALTAAMRSPDKRLTARAQYNDRVNAADAFITIVPA